MKTLGSTLAFTRERNMALIRTFRRLVADVDHIAPHVIARRLVDSPSPRFWVSEERATAVISAIIRGKPVLDSMRPSKREMFLEIYRRVCAIRRRHPHRKLLFIVSEVINSPAPKFYMEPSSALERLYKIRNGWYDKHNY